MGVCWTMVWWRIAAETPASAPRCSAAERAYIEHALAIEQAATKKAEAAEAQVCLLYTSPSPRDATLSRMPSSA